MDISWDVDTIYASGSGNVYLERILKAFKRLQSIRHVLSVLSRTRCIVFDLIMSISSLAPFKTMYTPRGVPKDPREHPLTPFPLASTFLSRLVRASQSTSHMGLPLSPETRKV